jgi:hypothetical protein
MMMANGMFDSRSDAHDEARSRADNAGRPFRVYHQNGYYGVQDASEPFEGKEIAVMQPDPTKATLKTEPPAAASPSEARKPADSSALAQAAMPDAAEIYAQRRAAMTAKVDDPDEPARAEVNGGALSALPDPAEVYARRAAIMAGGGKSG